MEQVLLLRATIEFPLTFHDSYYTTYYQTLSELFNDFSHLLTRYFGTELQSPYNYHLYSKQHLHRCGVDKWVTMNRTEHSPDRSAD